MFTLPRSARTRRIVLAYSLNRIGTWFGYVALSVEVYDRTHSALAVAALLLSGQVVAALAVPLVIARIERRGARGGLSALYAFEALATAAMIAVIADAYSLPALLVLVAADGTAALAAGALLRTAAARSAREWAQSAPAPGAQSTPDRAAEAERIANAALNIGFAVAFSLGPAFAGLIVPAFGVPAALAVDAVSFALCGALLVRETAIVEGSGDASVAARIRAARSHLDGSPALRTLLAAQALALVFFTFGAPLEVLYSKASLHAGDSGYGIFVGVWGLGVTLGSVIFARSIARSLKGLLIASTLIVGLSYIGLAGAGSIELACAIGLFGGVGNGIQWASLISSVQWLTPQAVRGQMMGVVEMLGAVCPAIGYSLAGAIAYASSPRQAFLVGGIGAIVSVAGFLYLPRGALSGAGAEQGREQEPADAVAAVDVGG